MRNDKYILNERGEPVSCSTLEEWAQWFSSNQRIVKQEMVCGYKVSTVFLALDHSFRMEGPPVLWETMVFKKVPKSVWKTGWVEDVDQSMERCSGSREQAMAMHERMVEKVRDHCLTNQSRKSW